MPNTTITHSIGQGLKLKQVLFVALVGGLTPYAHAELPLDIEGLMSAQGQWRTEQGFSYANRQNNTAVGANPIELPTSPTTRITLPTVITQVQGNSDVLVSTLGLRYGLSDKAEVYGRINALSSESRVFVWGGGGTSDRRDYWADGWLGINYQFLEDRDTPAFFGFTEVALFEHQENRNARYRSFIVGGSTYHAIDPVVLSLAASYQFNHAREDGDDYVQPGNSFSLTPSFAFAVNDRVSFSLGTQWALREPDRRNQEKQNTRNSSTAWNAGVAYSATPHNSFNMGFGYSVSGTASIRFNWVHSFARSLEAYALRSRKGG